MTSRDRDSPHAALREARKRAHREGRRVAVIFRSDWCRDCQALDTLLEHPLAAPLVEAGYVLLRVDVGRGDRHADLAQDLGVPLRHGIPAIAVLEPDGRVVHAQDRGEFRNARSLDPVEVASFLGRWLPRSAKERRQTGKGVES